MLEIQIKDGRGKLVSISNLDNASDYCEQYGHMCVKDIDTKEEYFIVVVKKEENK